MKGQKVLDEALRPRPPAASLFQAYVTSVAFHLTLSRGMVDTLLALHELGATSPDERGCPEPRNGHFIQHVKSLIHRGLIGHYQPPREDGKHWTGEPGCPRRPGYYLTSAGAAVVPLLKMAGF